MPTGGTHITIIERLALNPDFAAMLGDPLADDPDSHEAKLLRFAKLGAIGPDIFYALMDYTSDLQDMVNFVAKIAGSFECISHITHNIDSKITLLKSDVTFGTSDLFKKALDEIQETFTRVSAVINEGLMATAITNGVNFFPMFEARRQLDEGRTTWFWADYLHYVNSGEFVRQLFILSEGKPHLIAFSYGYLSHYVTDIVGHPFVNAVVGAPWRLYWQRHHLVENFIDAYVWDRWHDAQPEPVPPSIEEQPLDKIRSSPHASAGQGAPMTFARLNDHINIGYPKGQLALRETVEGQGRLVACSK
jgi:hypothetical protein